VRGESTAAVPSRWKLEALVGHRHGWVLKGAEKQRGETHKHVYTTHKRTHTHVYPNGSMTETATSVRAANVSVLRELPALFRDC